MDGMGIRGNQTATNAVGAVPIQSNPSLPPSLLSPFSFPSLPVQGQRRLTSDPRVSRSDRPFRPSTNSSCSPRCTPFIFLSFRVSCFLSLVLAAIGAFHRSVLKTRPHRNNNDASFSVSAPSFTRAGMPHYLSFYTLFRSIIITPTASGPTLSELQFLNPCALVPRPRALLHIPPTLFRPCLPLVTFARPLSSQGASSTPFLSLHTCPS